MLLCTLKQLDALAIDAQQQGVKVSAKVLIRMSKQDVQELIDHEKEKDNQRMDTLLKQVDITDLKPHMHLIEGDPDFRIPEIVVKENIDLLVMGVKKCKIGGVFLGALN